MASTDFEVSLYYASSLTATLHTTDTLLYIMCDFIFFFFAELGSSEGIFYSHVLFHVGVHFINFKNTTRVSQVGLVTSLIMQSDWFLNDQVTPCCFLIGCFSHILYADHTQVSNL